MPRLASRIAFPLLAAFLVIVAVAAARAQEKSAPDLAAGESKYNGSCVACHGASGASQIEANPILAGQHFEYTRKQLLAYQSGERKNAIMAGMVAPLAAADIDNIAAFLAAAKSVIAGALDIDLARTGENLYRAGDGERALPACAACHGPAGAGVAPHYPRLSGQYAPYTRQTMLEFKSGARADEVMNAVAAELTEAEIDALAEYISGLAR